MMNQRLAVRHLTVLAGTAALLPGCLSQAEREQPASVPLKHSFLTARDEALLTQVCETLLPRTDTPGAQDLRLPQYVLKMLDDCTPPKDQQTFVAGLRQFDDVARKQLGQASGASTAAQRTGFLQRIDQQPKSFPGAVVVFYRAARQLTIDGYAGSQFFMTKEVVQGTSKRRCSTSGTRCTPALMCT